MDEYNGPFSSLYFGSLSHPEDTTYSFGTFYSLIAEELWHRLRFSEQQVILPKSQM